MRKHLTHLLRKHEAAPNVHLTLEVGNTVSHTPRRTLGQKCALHSVSVVTFAHISNSVGCLSLLLCTSVGILSPSFSLHPLPRTGLTFHFTTLKVLTGQVETPRDSASSREKPACQLSTLHFLNRYKCSTTAANATAALVDITPLCTRSHSVVALSTNRGQELLLTCPTHCSCNRSAVHPDIKSDDESSDCRLTCPTRGSTRQFTPLEVTWEKP